MGEAVRFLLGDRPVAVEGVPPDTTVLDWLRLYAGRIGTKEGCAEGDCGACTVVLGVLEEGRLAYRAVNACILFVPVLDGKQLLTVEDLAGRDGALHPVQGALVDHHASQCGFCTPGFVMSLFAHQHGGADRDDDAILDTFAGNLCRCTGYRPIVEAARALGSASDRFAEEGGQTKAALAALRRDSMLDYRCGTQRFVAPRTVEALATLLVESPGATMLAGGTDVGLWVTKQHRRLDTIVYLGEVAGLDRITVAEDGALEIGAAATYTALLSYLDGIAGLDPSSTSAVGAVHRDAPYQSLRLLLTRLGSTQIRNLGTVGGNIANASPIGDSMPWLMAVGAEVILSSRAGRRVVPIDRLFLGYRQTVLEPGDFIESVRIPPQPSRRLFRTYKVSKRLDQDISAVCAGIAVDVEDGRVTAARMAFGGMVATPKRAAQAEAVLAGARWDRATVRSAMAALDQDYNPIDDFRASARYRTAVARNLLWRFWLETAPGTGLEGSAPDRPLTQVTDHARHRLAG